MSLDITIKERKEFHCPDCGRLVTILDIEEEHSGGRVWYDRRTDETALQLCFRQ